MSKEAMRQALDALELNTTIEGGYCSCCGHQPCLKTCSVIQAIDALRAALDAPEPEPLSDARIDEISTFVYLHNKGSDAQFARAIEQEVRGGETPPPTFAPFDAEDDFK